MFREARRLLPDTTKTLLYHSRYRYRARVERQDEVIAEFAYEDQAKTRRLQNHATLAVTTQVCEMSLDISADVLVTARCPLPALVQRLGRLNRYATSDDPKPCLVYPFEGRPYHGEESSLQMAATSDMIAKLRGRPCSQSILSRFVARLDSHDDWEKWMGSAWLDGGWQSEPRPVARSTGALQSSGRRICGNCRDHGQRPKLLNLRSPCC